MTTHTSDDCNGSQRRVLLVDDHPIVREGLARLINRERDLCICGEADDGKRALELVETAEPDIAIVDLSLRDTNGIELTKRIMRLRPKLPVLVLSMHDEQTFAERALRAGARGYVMKQEAAGRILAAVRRVLAGEIYLSEAMAGRVLASAAYQGGGAPSAPQECLSDRELEVFQLIGRGLGPSQIAKQLHLSVKTIESHKANIQQKLDLRDGSHLIQFAIEWTKAL